MRQISTVRTALTVLVTTGAMMAAPAVGQAQDPLPAPDSGLAALAKAVEQRDDKTESRTEAWLATLQQASKTWMRHLPASPHEMMLGGEHAVRKIPIYFPAGEAGRTTELRVAAVSAISALPEASSVTVFVNGLSVGTIALRAGGPSTLTVPIQPGQVVEGFNEVMFVASHQHRIDCSLEGTYELWTRILPERTGFIVSQAEKRSSPVSDMAAVLGRNPAPSTLRLHLPGTLDSASATRLGRFVNTTVLNGWIANPEIALANGRTSPAGIELKILDTLPQDSASTTFERFDDTDHLYAEVSRTGETRALILAGAPAAIDRELDRLEDKARARGASVSARGQEALVAQFGRELDSAGHVTFGSLGAEDVSFAGRHFLMDVPILLPGDYYQADYGSLNLFLDGSYAANLRGTSQLVVKVNGVDAVSLPLNDTNTTFDGKEVRIPLKLFHAGLNTLSLEADLRTEADLACVPENAAVMTPRFKLSKSSRIQVPTMARVGVVPNLAATMSHGLPYTLDEAPTELFVVGERAEGLRSALSMAAEITANAQRMEPFRIAFRPPTEDEGGIIVGPASAMPAWARSIVGEKVSPAEDADPAVPEGPQISSSEPTRQTSPVRLAMRSDIMTDAVSLRQHLAGDDTSDGESGPLAWLKGTAHDARVWLASGSWYNLDWLAEEASALGDVIFGAVDPVMHERKFVADDVVFAQRAYSDTTGMEKMSEAVLRNDPPRTWTVVVAEAPEQLASAFDGDAPSGVVFNPSGQHYVYSDARDRMIEAGEAGQLYATRSPSFSNLRLVLAGWLSANKQIYVYLITSVLVLFGALTYVSVRRRRGARAS